MGENQHIACKRIVITDSKKKTGITNDNDRAEISKAFEEKKEEDKGRKGIFS